MQDIKIFHQNFYSHENKVDQDNFIIKHCEVKEIKRRRPKTGESVKAKSFSVVYKVRKNETNKLIPVCRNAFSGVLKISKDRIAGVLKRFWDSGHMAKENRGGDRKTNKFSGKRRSVMEFIQRFKVIESHYCRNRTNRKYLPSTLNITKMWRMYSSEFKDTPLEVKKSYFRGIFNRCYNIGFGSPRTDVCSVCLQLKEKIKVEKSDDAKKKLIIEYHVHKLRAKAFFEFLKEENPELLTISFDCQKNQVLPKLPDQSVYYSRQLYIYNFTAVTGSSHSPLTKENVSIYTWTEDQYNKGSNEISSAVFHKLNQEDFTNKKVVRLVADGCGGQNKNSILMAMCIKWLGHCAPPSVTKLEVIFPVVGHSFIPPDRVFARIEKVIKKMETIVTVTEYENIFADHGTVFKLGSDVDVKDWKQASKLAIKPPGQWHASFSASKRFILNKSKNGQVTVRAEQSYKSDLGMFRSVFKKNKSINDIDPVAVMGGIPPNPKKLDDVKTLLVKHYGDDWVSLPELSYYKSVLQTMEPDQNIEENVAEDILCEEVPYIPDLIV